MSSWIRKKIKISSRLKQRGQVELICEEKPRSSNLALLTLTWDMFQPGEESPVGHQSLPACSISSTCTTHIRAISYLQLFHRELKIFSGRVRWVRSGFNQWIVLQCWSAGYFIFILSDTILDHAKNVFPLLKPKFLVMWERIGEELPVFVKYFTLFSANSTGARGWTALHGMALKPFSSHW
jgi:hypothetical protein